MKFNFFVFKLFFAFSIMCFSLQQTDAQVTLYTEDFSGYPDGTTVGTNWDASLFNSCDNETGPNGTGWAWGVFNGEFVINDMEGFNCCGAMGNIGDNSNTISIGPIDITGYVSIEISFDFSTTGSFECEFTDNGQPCPGADAVPYCSTMGGHDQAIFSYSVDGGVPIVFGYWCGDQFCYGQDFFCGDITGSNLDIIITAGNQATGEFYMIDNIEVTGFLAGGSAIAEANGTPVSIDLCEGDQLDLDETSGDGVMWDWIGPNGFTSTSQNPTVSNSITTAMDGDYIVTIVTGTGCTSSNTVTVNINPSPSPGIPDPLQICYSLAPPAAEILNLDEVIDQLSNFDPSLSINWWFDAAATTPLDFNDPTDIQTLILSGQTTIYATVDDGNCQSSTQAVTLIADTYPILNTSNGTLMACINGGNASFNPHDADSQFTNDGSLIINYYNSQMDAEDDNNPILGNVNTSSNQTLYVRIENAAGCPAYAELELIIDAATTATDASLSACDDGSGTGNFDLTSIENDVLNGEVGNVTFYENANGTLEIFVPDNFISGSITVYAIINAGGNCPSNIAEVELSLISFILNDAFLTFSPTSSCGPTDVDMILHVPLSPLGDFSFNIDYGPASTGTNNTINVSGIEGETVFTINISEDYIFILNSVTSPAPDFCEQFFNTPIEYTINIDNGANAFPADISACPDGNGQGLFDLTTLVNTINNGSGDPVDFYEDMALMTAINNPSNYTSGTTIIYAIVDAGGGCVSNPVPITVTVNTVPMVSITLQQGISCTGDANAILDVTVTGNSPYVYDWSVDSWDGLDNVTDVGPGDYFLTVTDANMCSVTADISVDDPTVVVLDCHENTALEGNGIGSYAFTYSGGTPFYILDLDGPIDINFTTNTPDTWQTAVLPSGDYTFTLTDANGCFQSCSFNIPASCDVVIDCAQTNAPTSVGGSDGGLDLIIAGSMPPFTINWNGPVNGTGTANTAGLFQITGLVIGPYTVTVIDANGCEEICGFIISNISCNFSTQISGTNITCNGDTNGTINLTFTNGSPDYTFSWSDANLNNVGPSGNQINLGAGDYAVTITGQDGCMATASITLTQPPAISLSCSVVSHPSQAANSDGSIDVFFDGPLEAFVISYDNGSGTNGMMAGVLGSSNIIPNLPEGTYSITVTNGTCQQTCQVTLSASNCTFDLAILAVNETCEGENDGTATVIASGGNPAYIFNWSNSAVTSFITNLAPDSYFITVTDGAGCIALDTAIISTDNSAPTFNYNIANTTICADSCLTVNFTLTGQAPYTLDYIITNNGFPLIVQFPIPADTGELEICPNDLGFAPGTFNLRFVALSDVNCNVSFDESIDLTYLPPAIGNLSEILCPGDSLVINGIVFNENNLSGSVVVDEPSSMGCDSTVNVTISFYTPIVGLFDSLLCSGESMIYGGVVFDINNLSQQVTLPDATNTGCDSLVDVSIGFYPIIIGSFDSLLCSGESMIYGGVVFDINNLSQQVILPDATSTGCDSLIDVSIGFYPTIIGSFDSLLCSGESMIYGGVVFDINNLSQQVTLPDATSTGCDSLIDVSIDFYPASDTLIERSICQADTLVIGGELFHLNRLTGVVILEGNSINGCDSTITVNLNISDEVYGLLNIDLCAGDTINIEGQDFHEGLLIDTIPLGILSSAGCDTLLIVEINLLQPITEVFNTDICAGDSLLIGGQFFHSTHLSDTLTLDNAANNGCDSIIEVNLNLLPNPTFNWAVQICQGDTLFIGDDMQTTAGMATYLLEGEAANGCDSIVNVDLSFYEVVEETINPTACTGEIITIEGRDFDVDNPDGIIIIEGASSNGCDSTLTVNAIFLPNVMGSLDTLLCFGESLQIGDQTFNAGSPNGFVTFENQAANGCDSILMVSTAYREIMSASLTGGTLICPNESAVITLTTSGNFTYDYIIDRSIGVPLEATNQMGDQTFPIFPSESILFTLSEMTTSSACPITIFTPTAEVLVSVLDINASVLSDFNGFGVSCPEATDGSAEVVIADGIGPFTYLWSNGATSSVINNIPAGAYAVLVTDGADCNQEVAISLSSSVPMIAEAEGIASGCFGDTGGQLEIQTISNGLPPYEYSLDGEFFSQVAQLPQLLTQLASGNYTLSIIDANDCSLSLDVFVPEANQLILELGNDETEFNLGDSVLLNPLINFVPSTWTWTPTDFLSQPDSLITYASPPETTLYQLDLVDENGCTISDNIRIFVNKELDIYIPSAFSPNGDGINDVLTILAGQGVKIIQNFQIYDRWGNLMFSRGPFAANDPLYGWDGELNGQPLNAAIFVYFAEVELITGEVILVKGDVMLMR